LLCSSPQSTIDATLILSTMSELTDLLQYRLFGNVISDWVLALIAFLVTFIVLPLVPGYLARKARHQVGETHSVPVELMLRLIPRTSRLFLWIVAIKAAEAFLHLPASVHRALTILVLVVVWLQTGLWAMAIVNYLLDRQRPRRGEHDTGFVSSLAVINFIAGLGIGGIAIALAVQTILGETSSPRCRSRSTSLSR